MKKIIARTIELKGSSYEIGRTLGKFISSVPPLKHAYTAGFDGFGIRDIHDAEKMFEQWCPGLVEELTGFADEVKTDPENIIYYAMTYLHPNCSQMAISPSKTENRHPLLARNYEFNDEAEDFILMKTIPDGKYAHMGTSVLSFGRDDGFNEHGLAITMSSCGFPVGANKGMRQPAIRGLQFWAVIRSLLENCRDTKEALHFLNTMPIAYNLNLILMDKSGTAALVETLDGRIISHRMEELTDTNCLYATNHPIFDELIALEANGMVHSLRRRQYIKDTLEHTETVTQEQLKTMLLSPYPDGLCCHHYNDFFGTTKSMVIDPVDGTIELCWGGRKENRWNTYRLSDPLPYTETEIVIDSVPAPPALFKFQPIRD